MSVTIFGFQVINKREINQSTRELINKLRVTLSNNP